jgi:hypothetical protein
LQAAFDRGVPVRVLKAQRTRVTDMTVAAAGAALSRGTS